MEPLVLYIYGKVDGPGKVRYTALRVWSGLAFLSERELGPDNMELPWTR